jgi:hypothetical protein
VTPNAHQCAPLCFGSEEHEERAEWNDRQSESLPDFEIAHVARDETDPAIDLGRFAGPLALGDAPHAVRAIEADDLDAGAREFPCDATSTRPQLEDRTAAGDRMTKVEIDLAREGRRALIVGLGVETVVGIERSQFSVLVLRNEFIGRHVSLPIFVTRFTPRVAAD